MKTLLKDDLQRILGSPHLRKSDEVIRDLWDLCPTLDVESAESLLMAHPGFLDHRPALARAFHEMVAAHEISQSRQLLERESNGSETFAEIATAISLYSYKRSADMFDYLDFDACRRMVLVGAGWVPATLFYVHERTDVAELIGLDIVPDAVATANELAKRLGYGRVRAELQNGSSFDYRQTQIAYIVGMVGETKSAVLSRIADTAPDNVQVLLNEPYSLGRLWSEAVEPSLDRRLEIVRRAPGRATRRDLVLRLRSDALRARRIPELAG